MNRIAKLAAAGIALACAGCFTLKETPVPSVQMSKAPQGKDVKLQVSGFAATITQYVPVYGYQTYLTDRGVYGRYGHYHYVGPHLETVTTETLVPQVAATDVFIKLAQARFEENGFLLRANPADYTVTVDFGGPFITDGERAVETAWMLCSIFSAEYTTQTWTAKLNIHDVKTGKVIFHHDYSQKYEFCAWSPLFFIGLAGVTKDEYNYMQSWCLTVLTDRACADATSFLASL